MHIVGKVLKRNSESDLRNSVELCRRSFNWEHYISSHKQTENWKRKKTEDQQDWVIYESQVCCVDEAVLPYSRMSMIQLLGKIPDKFCSQHTAEDMALLAYNRALKLFSPGL